MLQVGSPWAYPQLRSVSTLDVVEKGPRPATNGGVGKRQSKDAYVTLLYGGFLLGARVLGQSLRETGTKKELIALCTETVLDTTKEILKRDGWTIRPVQKIHSPYEGLSARGNYFAGAFSKLHIWNMTDYDRIVYLDSDVLVVKNIDHMFDCGTFCAALRHSDLFNTGVMVIQPNRSIFNDMLGKVEVFPSYTQGDQGFLNVYFKDLVYAPFFNWSSESRQHQLMRMPAGLNSDIGIYYTTSRWVIPEDEIRNIHYTLGPTKPWIWWTNFLFNLNEQWTNVRKRLQQYPDYSDTYFPCHPLFWLPIPVLILLYAWAKFFDCSSSHRWTGNPLVSRLLEAFVYINRTCSQFLPIPVVVLSYYLAYQVVPTTMLPGQAEFVFWLWSNCFIVIVVSLYRYMFHISEKKPGGNHQGIPRKKLWLAILYVLFALSYTLLKVVTPMVMPFSKRAKVFFLLTTLHVVVTQATGMLLIKSL
jgi:alpha-N-acetylglucosamine transferase